MRPLRAWLHRLAGLVRRHGAGIVAAGLVLGSAGAFMASRYAESLLFNVRAVIQWRSASPLWSSS